MCWRVWGGETRTELRVCSSTQGGARWVWAGVGWEDKERAQGMYIYTGWDWLGVWMGVGCVGRQEEPSGYVHLHRVGIAGCVDGCGVCRKTKRALRVGTSTQGGAGWVCGWVWGA